MDKGIELLADYVFLSKYSQRKADGRLETWDETVDRIYAMHRTKLFDLGLLTPDVDAALDKAADLEKRKKMLSSQRGRQFASPSRESGILKHEAKMYNCCATYINRMEVFGEIMYLLLCGCGVGYSLHRKYIDMLPEVSEYTDEPVIEYSVHDSIEGWADSIDILIRTLYNGGTVEFDYSRIRPAGSLIDGKFVAPGPEPLRKAHAKITEVVHLAAGRKMKSIEIYDVLCHIAQSVVSGGVRRAATIALFDKDDELMLKAKTGSWWQDNPQRAMSNNSMLTTAADPLTYSELKDAIKVVRQFGEPGFMQVSDYQWITNPCGEILMRPSLSASPCDSGFAFCNLVEVNAERIESEEDFYATCKMAAFMGTVQSLYTDFKYLSESSRLIAERDRAIGVSITGFFATDMLTGDVLERGASIVKDTNRKYAARFGINESRACTTVKPSGNASAILGLLCSGIHPAHAHEYIRRVRIKTDSPEYLALKDTPMVKRLSDNEAVISFPVKSDNGKIITKDELNAVEHLKYIAKMKHYWINKGVRADSMPNNISATVEVRDDEWGEVAAVLFTNSHLYTGVSLLPSYGDQIYDNAPFQRPSTEELKAEYDAILDYINTHEVDFNAIMSSRGNIYSGDMAAIGCSGGSCELR